jgi:dienelactone hydrolase
VRLRSAILTVLAALAAGCGGAAHASLAVRASSDLADAPVTVTVTGVPGHAALHATWRDFFGHAWRSTVSLHAGTVALSGIDGMRFLWGMRPDGPAFKHPFFQPAVGPSSVALAVSAGGRTVARTTLVRRVTPPTVRGRKLTNGRDGVDGFLYTPTVKRRRGPAVLVFGGSEGGNSMYPAAALLAAHGYPALSLTYFGVRGLPSQLVRIPLEYFARAVRVLRRLPGVDRRRIVVMGSSRGGELALLLASTFPRLIHGAIGLVPSDSVYPSPAANLPAWTLHGRGILPQPIRVQRVSGPVLVAGAGDDKEWASKESVLQIERRLKRHHFRYAHSGLVYERAGHLIGSAVPYTPVSTQEASFGGTPRADVVARADLWQRILRYFARL